MKVGTHVNNEIRLQSHHRLREHEVTYGVYKIKVRIFERRVKLAWRIFFVCLFGTLPMSVHADVMYETHLSWHVGLDKLPKGLPGILRPNNKEK